MVRIRFRAAAPHPGRSSSSIRRPRGSRKPPARICAQPAVRRVVVQNSESEDGDVSVTELVSERSSPSGEGDDSIDMDDSRLNMSHNESGAHESDETESSKDDQSVSYESDDEVEVIDMDDSLIVEDGTEPNSDDDSDDSSDFSVSTPDSSVATDLDESIPADVIRSAEHGHCSICFEDAPSEPMGCIMCRQLIGCKRCVDKWFRTGIKKKERREENAENHFMCPLCRHPWEEAPEIDSIFGLD